MRQDGGGYRTGTPVTRLLRRRFSICSFLGGPAEFGHRIRSPVRLSDRVGRAFRQYSRPSRCSSCPVSGTDGRPGSDCLPRRCGHRPAGAGTGAWAGIIADCRDRIASGDACRCGRNALVRTEIARRGGCAGHARRDHRSGGRVGHLLFVDHAAAILESIRDANCDDPVAERGPKQSGGQVLRTE